jgi:type I restriction enzyme M protein
MVRLSLVNMYLHGFADPHIFEYDTLTSQDRWNEYADVILANPPFMSPKGGIKPHNRFSVQSKRSEVLFVDYMAEHLTPNGRAGIIVPEDIIFQSQTAYKQLRKMLVEEYLVAVVSLPAGVFQPYSGVKTSILILDKSLAKRIGTIAFFKVENDGFGLGAQRREIDKNDLPQAHAGIGEYLHHLRAGETVADFEPTLGLIVEKEKVAANGEYNLSGERYREGVVILSTFPLELLVGLFTKIGNGVNVTQVDEKGKYRVTRIQTIADGTIDLSKTKFTNDEVKPESFLQFGDILLSHINSIDHLGKSAIFLGNDADVIHGINLIRFVPDTSRINPHYAIRIFKTDRFIDTVRSFAQKAVNQASVKTSDLRGIQIPLPPLEVQKEIVAEIEGYQKVINGARAVLDNYRPHIPIHPDWPMVELGEICSLGGAITTDVEPSLPYFGADSIESNTGRLLKTQSAESQNVRGPVYAFSGRRLLYSKIRPYLNKLTVVDLRGYCSSDMYPLTPDRTKAEITYLTTFMLSDTFNERIRGYYERASIPKINRSQLFETKIPLPPLATQQAIVAEIEAEQTLVAANRELIARFEKKIQATLARVWGEES